MYGLPTYLFSEVIFSDDNICLDWTFFFSREQFDNQRTVEVGLYSTNIIIDIPVCVLLKLCICFKLFDKFNFYFSLVTFFFIYRMPLLIVKENNRVMSNWHNTFKNIFKNCFTCTMFLKVHKMDVSLRRVRKIEVFMFWKSGQRNK